jgi:hypothetical protein
MPGIDSPQPVDIVIDMKTISVAVSESVYEEFRKAARESDRSIAQLIREAMKLYRDLHLGKKKPLHHVDVFPDCRLTGTLPARQETRDEMSLERLDRG